MLPEKEIKSNHKAQHDTLSKAYYAGTSGLTKEQFDVQHGKVWTGMETELIAGGYLTIPEPPRDLEAELDNLKERLGKLEKK